MENKKHILFISSWYPGRQDPTHGIFNRYFAEAASLFNTISVLHVSASENMEAEFEFTETTENNITTFTAYYKRITPALPLISQLKKRNKVMKAFELGFEKLRQKIGMPDLIQLNVIMPMGLGAYHLSKKYNIPYVINEGWSGYCEEDGNYKGFIKQFYTRRIVKKAKAIMPTSNYLKKAMLSHGLEGNYIVVPNVVNTDVFKPMEFPANEVLKLIHISSLNDREKNVSGLIRAFAKALEINPAIELNIIGDGPGLEYYQNSVRELKLKAHIKFKGRLLAKDLVHEINANDALIMFSNYETFCLVIIEAFACGKPVITSDAGAIKDYMRPELGIMVEKQNEPALTQAIVKFAQDKQKYDRGFIRQFAVANYSYRKIGEKLKKVYDLALSKNQSL